MRLKLQLAMICIIFAVSGCSRLRDVKQPPLVIDTEPTATVIMMRKYHFYGSALRLWATVDDKDIAGMYTDQYTSFLLNQGVYSFGVRCNGGWTPGWKIDEISVTVQPDKNYYFLLGMDFKPLFIPFLDSCAEIKEITEDESEKILENAMFLSPGTYSDDFRLLPR